MPPTDPPPPSDARHAHPARFPALPGATLALAAAALFGASTPLVQRFGTDAGPWATAALLYFGAALAALTFRSGRAVEAPVARTHLPRLAIVALFGAVLGPVALAWGLQRTSALSGSLVLTFEAVFTVALARLFYGETLDRRVGLAVALITAGGVLLVADRAGAGAVQVAGLVAVVVATLAWAIDNSLSRALADIDPGSVVLGKGALGAALSAIVAVVAHDAWPALGAAAALAAVGAVGYGLSLRFYLLAQRSFGAARTGSVFATAPFLGALLAFALGDRGVTAWVLVAFVLMAVGVALHATESHVHEHAHEPLEHEHAHTHDDGHHLHTHDPMPAGPHSHRHRHEAMTHSHPHAPDLHHTHGHDPAG